MECKWCETPGGTYDLNCDGCKNRIVMGQPCKLRREEMAKNIEQTWGFLPDWKKEPSCGCTRVCVINQGSKLNNRLTQRERRHLAAVKEMPCGVCGAAGPSDAHHIEQGQQFLCIPLCKDCHQGSHNGIHGRKAIWNVTKKTELSVLNDIVEKLTR
jgi:hypothetical protein